MKLSRIITLLFLLLGFSIIKAQDESDLLKQISNCSEISDIESLSSSVYKEKYVMYLNNPINWSDPNSDTFKSRLILCYKGIDRPTVIVTEGYYANYALYPSYEDEISHLFNTNVIVCEHRFFGKSIPDSLNWKDLTVENALADIHHARKIFGKIFKGKWICTGISKGGQTTMFYKTQYPEDSDIGVAYVAPLNKGVEDGRHEEFLSNSVGTESERNMVFLAQRELLKRKPSIISMFEKYSAEHNYNYRKSINEIYDYCIFELPFAFWQWGTPINKIPSLDASNQEWFNFLIKISDPDYFSYPTATTPFFVQAAYELGYYGYSTKGLEDLCNVQDTHNYLYSLMLPPDANDIVFNKSLYEQTVDYLRNNDPKLIFIYGENDPWSASGVCQWLDCSEKCNMKVFIQPRGSHTARIRTMPNNIYREIMSCMTKWLE